MEKKAFVFISDTHILAKKKEITWDDLKSVHFLARKNTTSEKMVVDNFVYRGWQPNLQALNLNRDDLFELVGLGQGIMVTGLTSLLRLESRLISRPL